MPARRAALPLLKIQWQTWVVMVVVLALVVATAVLLVVEEAR